MFVRCGHFTVPAPRSGKLVQTALVSFQPQALPKAFLFASCPSSLQATRPSLATVRSQPASKIKTRDTHIAYVLPGLKKNTAVASQKRDSQKKPAFHVDESAFFFGGQILTTTFDGRPCGLDSIFIGKTMFSRPHCHFHCKYEHLDTTHMFVC